LTKHKPHLLGWILLFVPELFSLYWYLKRESIKLVHCNTSWQVKGILAGKMAGAKIIWHLQDTWTPKGIKMLFHLLASLCDGFIVAGNRVKQYYLNSKMLKAKKDYRNSSPYRHLVFQSEFPYIWAIPNGRNTLGKISRMG